MIRKANCNDKEKYISMATDFYNTDAVLKPIPKNNIEDTFEEIMRQTPFAELFIFEYEGNVAGYALTAKTFSQEGGGICLWLEEIYVLPEYRGKGIGHEFLQMMKKRLNAEVRRIRLEVELENKGAVKLYKSFGFDFFEYKQMIMK